MSHTRSGFSAVELLVTLFVAATFLLAGYQLYIAIVRDSGEVRQQARASNIAYDYLRQETDKIANACIDTSPVTLINNYHIAPDPVGLTGVYVTATKSCPQPTSLPRISKVTVTVRYGADQQEVTHAMFTTD